MGNIYPVGSAANGGTLYSDGSVRQAASYRNANPIGTGTGGAPIYKPYTNDVLGLATQNTVNTPLPTQQQPSGGGISESDALSRGWDFNNLPGGYSQSRPAAPDWSILSGQINSLADQGLSALDPQRAAQEGIATNSYSQGVSNLQAQQAQGNAQLDATRRKTNENQVRTLQDLTENLRNMFTSGQNYLGARGAGDSSAANQYSYALTQLGNKNRGNVMSQTASIMNDINDRASQLHTQVTDGIKQLDTEKQNALLGISQWYAQAQNQIRQTKGQNLVQLGQQALDQAINEINRINAQADARKNSLLQWAENNATTINGLRSNIAQVSQFNPTQPTAGALPGLTEGAVGSTGQYYPGSNERTDKNIFGF